MSTAIIVVGWTLGVMAVLLPVLILWATWAQRGGEWTRETRDE